MVEHYFCSYAVPVRLVGHGSHYGRLEVYYYGEWGTVCDHGWNDADARVVCKQLGFGSSGTAYKSAYYGQGKGAILLSNISCSGSESSLADCDQFGITTVNCTHANDAGVHCTNSDRSKL